MIRDDDPFYEPAVHRTINAPPANLFRRLVDDEDEDDLDATEEREDDDEGDQDVADDGEREDDEDEEHGEDEQPFDASAVGLKEISNLASFTVSSYKPGCGVKELRDDDMNQFWQ
jgi:anaphase-promoting complex subunit 10